MADITDKIIASSSSSTSSSSSSGSSCLGGPRGCPSSSGGATTMPVKVAPIIFDSPTASPPPPPSYTNPVGAPVVDPGLPLTSGSPSSSLIDLFSGGANAVTDPLAGVLSSILDLGGYGQQQEQVGGFAPIQQGNFGDFQSYDEQLASEQTGQGGNSFTPIIVVAVIGILVYFIYTKWG